jgi:broad specificity phosphatase PhoE
MEKSRTWLNILAVKDLHPIISIQLLSLFCYNITMTTTISLDEVTSLEGSTADVQRIYLIRHGQSKLNLPDPDGVHRIQGTSLGVDLSPLGEAQAKELFAKLAPKITHLNLQLISSNALRALKTIQCFSRHFGKKVFVSPGLRELGSGDWEGKRKEGECEETGKIWKSLSQEQKFVTPKMPTGESPAEVVARAILDLDKALQSAPGKTILGVSHDMTSNMLATHLNKVPLSDIPGQDLPDLKIGNCDLILIEVPTGKTVAEGRVTTVFKTNIIKSLPTAKL